MKLDQLIAALETATGPNRKLDAAIAKHIGWNNKKADLWWPPESVTWARRTKQSLWDAERGPLPLSAYTASLDAALTLMPEGHCWEVRHGFIPEATVWFIENEYDPGSGRSVPHGRHPIPAIALCIAALKARVAT